MLHAGSLEKQQAGDDPGELGRWAAWRRHHSGSELGGVSKVCDPVKLIRNALIAALSFGFSFFRFLNLSSRFGFLIPPAAMMLIASSSVATLPSWKYGAASAMSLSVGVLKAPSSFASLVKAIRP